MKIQDDRGWIRSQSCKGKHRCAQYKRMCRCTDKWCQKERGSAWTCQQAGEDERTLFG